MKKIAISQKHQNYMTAAKTRAYTVHCIFQYHEEKCQTTPNILYGKTLKQSTKNTTNNWASLSASLWMLRHTTFECVEGGGEKKVQSQKCWSNKVKKGCVSSGGWFNQSVHQKLTLNKEHWEMLHATTWELIRWALNSWAGPRMCTVHITKLSEFYSKIHQAN